VDSLTFYFDISVGKRLPEAIFLLRPKSVTKVYHHNTSRKELGLPITGRHKNLFKEGEYDDQWLSFVGEKNWIVFTQDGKFHKPGFESELSAIKQFKVGCFYIWGACAQTHEKALSLLKAMDAIIEAIELTPKPFIYKISKHGKLIAVKIP
jgi:hypothetical protein